MKNNKVKVVSFIFLALLFTVSVITIIAYGNNKKIRNNNYWLLHNTRVLYQSEKVLSVLKDIETGTRGYIITGDSIFLRPYFEAVKDVELSIAVLKSLNADNAAQQLKIDTLSRLAIRRLQMCRQVQQIRNNNNFELSASYPLLFAGKKIMDSIRGDIKNIQQEENKLLGLREQENAQEIQQTERSFLILFSSIATLLLVTFFAAKYFAGLRKMESSILSQLNTKTVFFSKRLDDILKGISDPFFALDHHYNIIFYNAVFENTTALGKTRLMGKNFFEIFPQYRQNIAGEKMKQVIESRNSVCFEVYEDFLGIWQEITVYPTSEGISVQIKDISARVAHEKELHNTRQLLEETNQVAVVGGWEVDMVLNTVKWTSVTSLIHETGPEHEPDLKTGINFYKEGESRETIIKLVTDAIENGTTWDAELQIVTAKGNVKWIRTKGKAEFDKGVCKRLFGTFQDIDSRKKMADHLLQKEKQFRSAFENPSIGMALLNPDSKTIEVNQALCNITGYTKEEFSATSLHSITHEDDKMLDVKMLGDIKKNPAGVFQYEKRYIHKRGHIVWIQLSVSAATDNNRRVLYHIALMQDITAKKQAEQKLVDERILLHTIIDNLPLNVYMKNRRYSKTLVNKSEAVFLNSTPEEILGKNDLQLYARDQALISMKEDREVFSSRKPILGRETKNVKTDGTETWFLTSKIPYINDDDEVTGLVGISYDITSIKKMQLDLEKNEQKLRTLFELSPVGFVMSDINGDFFIEYNDAFQKIIGYTREEIAALDFRHLTPPEYLHITEQIFISLVDKGSYGPFEKEYIRKDGSRVSVLLSGIKMKDTSNRELIWSVIQDITRLKQKEKELQQLNISIEEANKELAGKNEELEQFASVASHDLQEPLRMITGFINLIENKYAALLDDTGKKYLKFIVDGSTHMRQIIADILEYSRHGIDAEDKKAIDVGELLKEIRLLNFGSAADERATVEWKNMPVISADKTSLVQLFTNLIGNAIKYQKPGNVPIIKISAVNAGDKWQFSVADNGIGIDAEHKEKIFAIFKRLHSKEEYTGTGIGLAICKKIVHKYKGDIWIASETGHGTTFHFTLCV
jgi:PAS domain S-box-containing protein